MASPFVGRRQDLTVLASKLRDVRSGQPVVVLIDGSAGIGKTAFVDRFLGQWPDAQVLRASGEESEGLLAYGVIQQLLRSTASSGSYVGSAGLALEDHLKVGGQILDVLGGLQENGPVLVLIDDLHWIDQPSLKALVFVLRRLHADRVMVLLVVRNEEVDAVPEGLSRLIRDRAGTILHLRGLEVVDLQELAHLYGLHPLSNRAARRLHEHTEGNPLHVQALFHEVPAEDWDALDSSPPAPRSFSRLVLDRRAQCSDDARTLVDAAAVLGMRCLLDTAVALAGIADPLAAADVAHAAALLNIEEAVGVRTLVFPHPLVQAAIYHGLGAARRAALHRRAATLMIDKAPRLRHRVAAARGPDTELADELVQFAREEAGRGAWSSAGAHLVKASRLSADQPGRERLLLESVNWMLFGGSLSEAGVFTEEITSYARSPLRDCTLGQLALLEGRPAEAEELLASAWERRDRVGDAELSATIALRNASHAIGRLHAVEGAEWAGRALELTGTGSHEGSRAQAVLSAGLAYSGRISEAYAALGPPDRPGLPDPDDWVLLMRGVLKVVDDDFAGARSDLTPVATAALRRRSLQTAADALDWLSTADYYSGAWDDAILEAEQSLLIYTASERPYRAFTPSALVAVSVARGEWLRAERHIRETATEPLDYEFSVASTAIAHAQLAAARSDYTGVLAAIRPLLGFTHREAIDEPGFWPWQDLYADALVSLDRAAEADVFLRPHESLAARRGRRSMMARLARVRGRIEATQGRVEGARAAFVGALERIEQLRMPFELARTEMAFGGFLRRQGSRREAAAQLLAARSRLIELGAEPYLERCDRELRACGLTPRKRRHADGIRLTPQEVSVARLVASGLTNREVATELLLSTKTIEFHLSQIFGKLDITSRRQIAKHPHMAGTA